ncbi:putative sulfatase [Halococcus hamelinensis 100A6]|uniref:Putative sulfatase n=2 Tax=Halococcus hamelinensis TaxID=332168 RepID=M0LX12_9EURY|nr:putative sulfatase [Halococcus hamelinensis 100A6]
MCTPARSTMFTGQNPHQHGVRSNGVALSRDIPALPELLSEDGYRTHSAGKIHLDLYTLPVPQQVAHIMTELSTQADTPFAKRLRDTLSGVLHELLECPDDFSEGRTSGESHEGFSGRAKSPLARVLEAIHVPKWSDTALLFREAIENTVEDWPADSLSEAEWDAFSAELERQLAGMFEELDVTEFSELQYDPEAFPEAREVWESGRIDELPESYYGFDTTDFTGGHVNEIFGEYKDWLRETHPDAYDRLDFTHPDNTRGNTFQVLDEWSLPESAHYNHWISDRSIDFLEEQADEDDPFFMWCSYPDPHNPYAAPEPWGSMYDPADVSPPARREGELEDLPPFYNDVYEGEFFQLQGLYTDPRPEVDEGSVEELIAQTYGMVSYIDYEVGRVMDALEAQGLREDTIVIFLSDHGAMMGDHWMLRKGPFQFESLLHVPAIWSWPDEFVEDERIETTCSHTDLLPTLLDCCDVTSPHAAYEPSYRDDPSSWAGRSLAPLLTGEVDEMERSVVIENDEDYLGMRARTLITDRYKLTVYAGEEYGELFDLNKDPKELHNRWNDSEYAETKNRLYRELVDELVRQEGAVPPRRNVA